LKTGELIRVILAHDGPVNSVKLFKSKIVSASRETMIKMWDIDTGECLRQFIGHTHGLACLQYDGRTIVSGANDQTIKIWNAEVS
jgi:F-box and WD-40 domain protein 1/11